MEAAFLGAAFFAGAGFFVDLVTVFAFAAVLEVLIFAVAFDFVAIVKLP